VGPSAHRSAFAVFWCPHTTERPKSDNQNFVFGKFVPGIDFLQNQSNGD
jgi:hypothetical protein